MPHADNSVEYYESILTVLEEAVHKARRSKMMNVIGIDANAALGTPEVTDDGRIVGEYGLGRRNNRGHVFASWLQDQRLTAAATENHGGSAWTHKLWSTREQRQIDIILHEEVRRDNLEDVSIAETFDGKSDHRAAYARLGPGEHRPIPKRRQKVQIGWTPSLNDEGKPIDYHNGLDAALKDAQPCLSEAIAQTATSAAAKRPCT